jgi:hypothetical protein
MVKIAPGVSCAAFDMVEVALQEVTSNHSRKINLLCWCLDSRGYSGITIMNVTWLSATDVSHALLATATTATLTTVST